MPIPNMSFRIEGATDAAGKVQQFSPAALAAIRRAAKDRASRSVGTMRNEMAQEYTSKWATGMLARGITYRTFISGNGIDVKFYIQDRRELRYVTALLGGHFQRFPVGPFVIIPKRARNLRIPFPGSFARRFIRGPEKGQFAGSQKGGAIFVKSVIWGNKTGGFSRDVLSEVTQTEGALFVQDMMSAVQGVVVKTTS